MCVALPSIFLACVICVNCCVIQVWRLAHLQDLEPKRGGQGFKYVCVAVISWSVLKGTSGDITQILLSLDTLPNTAYQINRSQTQVKRCRGKKVG